MEPERVWRLILTWSLVQIYLKTVSGNGSDWQRQCHLVWVHQWRWVTHTKNLLRFNEPQQSLRCVSGSHCTESELSDTAWAHPKHTQPGLSHTHSPVHDDPGLSCPQDRSRLFSRNFEKKFDPKCPNSHTTYVVFDSEKWFITRSNDLSLNQNRLCNNEAMTTFSS